MSRKPYTRGSQSLADFKQICLLGEGAYSAVYKVLRLADNEIYALKKVKLPSLSDKEKQNALNEVRLLASVRHENIVMYKEAFFDDKTRCLCIITEYADSGDLFQQITKCQKGRTHLPESDVWRYVSGMCHGLKALHDKNILHRDMKCANIFLSTLGSATVAKLGDFNVSKVAKRGLCMTQTGTPYYASPEVWRDMPYDAKSDMWSLGCVIYEMLALRPPFRAEDMEGLYRKVLRGQYPRIPPHYSHDLSDLIGVLLQVNPRNRPSVDQLLQMPLMRRHSQDSQPECESLDLLQTIKLPKNVIDLSTCLPKPQYDFHGFGHLAEDVVTPSQESAADIAGGTQRHALAARAQSLPPRGADEASKAAADGGQGGYLASAKPDSLDAYLEQRNRLPPARRPSAGGDQESIAAASPLRESANPRGGRSLPRQYELPGDSGVGRGDAAAGREVPSSGTVGRAPPQYGQAYPSLPAPVARYGSDSEDPRVRHSPAPSSHASRSQAGLYGQSRRGTERRPMASYARSQYALGTVAEAAQPPAPNQQTSGRGRLRLPRIFSKAS